MASRVTVVVVDDHPFYRDGVSRGLSLSGQVRVVAEASNGREGIEAIQREHPDVALVDYKMADLDGIAVLHAVARDKLPTRVIMLSATSDDGALVFRALEEGAVGFLSKEAPRADLVEAVVRAAAGEVIVPPQLAGGVVEQIRLRGQPSGPVLSEREREVLRGFARGLSIPQVAAELFIGTSTVKTHAMRLYDKLGVSDRAAAVAEAMRRGLLE
ncbi:MAG TPA: response regulator transcription factor [Acidimicrobiales bacterium]|nr:response regulator transcription factor [Acidimicrobiales bacterium]